jgi:amidohydrolase
MDLLKRARALRDDLVTLRRDLHRHPELGFQETRTAGLVAHAMRALGFDVRTGVGITGVVAELAHGEGPVVAVRADMDALPIQERADHDYASEHPGIMHACGHDAHTSALVGAAHLLAELKDEGRLPQGTIRLLFQPSEEGSDAEGMSGAQRMIEAGAMEGVDSVLGLHVGGHLSSGKIYLDDGAVMAGSEEIEVEVEGKSAHAAYPEAGVDSVVLAAQGVLAVQQAVSRRINPMESGVVTFGTIHGGTALNVLAERVVLQGTLRYFDPDVRRRLVDTVEASFGMLERLGARVRVKIGPGYPPTVNDAAAVGVVREAVRDVVGEDSLVVGHPSMAAEDFAYLAREAPGVFFWVGAALPEPREHHSPRFDIDERVLPLCAALLARGAVALLEHPLAARTGASAP